MSNTEPKEERKEEVKEQQQQSDSVWKKLTNQNWFKQAQQSLTKTKEKIDKGAADLLRKIDGIDIRDRSEEEEALRAKLQRQH